MAGRNYIPPAELKLREHLSLRPRPTLIDDRRLAAPARHLPVPAVEERIAVHNREIQSLLLDNQRLAATHVALKQDLAAADQELRQLSTASSKIKVESDARVREIYERSVKMEAEVRLIDSLNAELAQVRGDVQKLSSDRKELVERLQAIDGDLAKARSVLQQVPQIKAEIESMRLEIQRGRAAIAYEKKVHASNIEQHEAMEKSLVSLTREIEKLQAELANAEKRTRAAVAASAAGASAPGYAAAFGNPEMVFVGNSYPDPYAAHQVQGVVAGGLQRGPGVTMPPHGPYDRQWPHVHR